MTGHYHQLYATNSMTFTPMVVDRTFTADELAIAVTLDDGTQPEVAYDASDGTFSFPLATAGQRYRLALTAGDVTGTYELGSPSPHLVTHAAGRSDVTRVTQPTPLDFSFGTFDSVATPVVATTGLWTFTAAGPGTTGDFTFDWQAASILPGSGPVSLLDAAQNDHVYVEMWEYDPSNEYARIAGVGDAAVTLTDGGTMTVNGTLSSIAPSSCAHFVGTDLEDLARLEVADPGSYTSPSSQTAICQAPSTELLGNIGCQPLTSEVNTNQTGDVDVEQTFANPFPASEFQGIHYDGEVVTIASPSGSVGVPVGMGQYIPVDITNPDCETNYVMVHSTVGLPGSITLAGTALAADQTPIAIGPDGVTASWTTTVTGPVDFWNVQLFALPTSGNAGSELIATVTTDQTSAGLAADLFEQGHAYVLVVSALLGNPDAAQGDFDTLVPPFEYAAIPSHSFTVTVSP